MIEPTISNAIIRQRSDVMSPGRQRRGQRRDRPIALVEKPRAEIRRPSRVDDRRRRIVQSRLAVQCRKGNGQKARRGNGDR